MPDLPKLPNSPNSSDNASQSPIDLSDKNCWLINGVPTMWSPTMSVGPFDTQQLCYVAYDLRPH